jgi:hypothetical protein
VDEMRRSSSNRRPNHGQANPNNLYSVAPRRLILVKFDKGGMRYTRSMASALLRLLAAVSLILMPLGMATTNAGDAAANRAVEMNHCDEHRQPASAPGSERHCAACIALPTLGAPVAAAGVPHQAPMAAARAEPLLSPAPEVATPPPKV